MSNARRNLLRAEMADEAAAGFPRLMRIPQTTIIWFLDYFADQAEAEREAILDALAESAARAFGVPAMPVLNERGVAVIPPALAPMFAKREGAGGMGGTRYSDLKMLSAEPAFRNPAGYHVSWRENFTPLHFQPRKDLLPDLDQMKAAKTPLVRKLLKKVLTGTLGLTEAKLAGGAKYVGRLGDVDVTIHADFGRMLSQLGYTVILKGPGGQPLALMINYERLWCSDARWDYLTEENAPRSLDFFAEQIAYLADLSQRVMATP